MFVSTVLLAFCGNIGVVEFQYNIGIQETADAETLRKKTAGETEWFMDRR